MSFAVWFCLLSSSTGLRRRDFISCSTHQENDSHCRKKNTLRCHVIVIIDSCPSYPVTQTIDWFFAFSSLSLFSLSLFSSLYTWHQASSWNIYFVSDSLHTPFDPRLHLEDTNTLSCLRTKTRQKDFSPEKDLISSKKNTEQEEE